MTHELLKFHRQLYQPIGQHKQYALTHKSRAIALALEVKKTAEMELKNRALSSQIQELKAMLSYWVPLRKKDPPPASAPHGHTKILFQDERAISATGGHIASQQLPAHSSADAKKNNNSRRARTTQDIFDGESHSEHRMNNDPDFPSNQTDNSSDGDHEGQSDSDGED